MKKVLIYIRIRCIIWIDKCFHFAHLFLHNKSILFFRPRGILKVFACIFSLPRNGDENLSKFVLTKIPVSTHTKSSQLCPTEDIYIFILQPERHRRLCKIKNTRCLIMGLPQMIIAIKIADLNRGDDGGNSHLWDTLCSCFS